MRYICICCNESDRVHDSPQQKVYQISENNKTQRITYYRERRTRHITSSQAARSIILITRLITITLFLRFL